MSESIVDISHKFFDEIVFPLLQEKYPEETSKTIFGLFGHGSEALKMDDKYSRDHHWGIRIDALMPADVFENKREEIMQKLGAEMPASFMGHELGESTRAGAGLAPDNLEWFLSRTIGIDHPPETYAEWLAVPEEDIVHVTNGEVWHDPDGRFTAIREKLLEYYPEPVWLRRMAHWCRYYSGMGTYALRRAILRDNELYASIAFTRSVYRGIQIAFMLDRTYYPYDKWIYNVFKTLPRMYDRLGDIVEEALKLSTSWERKHQLMDQMTDVLDQTMVEDGIIPAHPKYVGSPTSGYRLMENAYQQMLKKVPPDVLGIIPQWEQIHLERFVSGWVASIEPDAWLGALNLTEVE